MEHSPFNESIEITTINIGLITLLDKLSSHPTPLDFNIKSMMAFMGVKLIMTMSARKLIFGYSDRFLLYLRSLNFIFSNMFNIKKIKKFVK